MNWCIRKHDGSAVNALWVRSMGQSLEYGFSAEDVVGIVHGSDLQDVTFIGIDTQPGDGPTEPETT